ncbi:hypothetical protein PG984_003450 [Apiospora sp. TS-2023a]
MEVIAGFTSVLGFIESVWKVKVLLDTFNDAPNQVKNIMNDCESVEELLKLLWAELRDESGNLDKERYAALKGAQKLLDTTLKRLEHTVKTISEELGKVASKTKDGEISKTRYFWNKEKIFEPLLKELNDGEQRLTRVYGVLTGAKLGILVRERPKHQGAEVLSLPTTTKNRYLGKAPMELEKILRDVMKTEDASELEGLLEAGVSPETILNSWRDRPLHVVAGKGNLWGFQVLMKHGALVDEPNDNGTTPLIAALTKHHVEISLALLDADASPRSQTKMGKTPLYYAAWGNLLAPVEKLLAAGAVVNAPDSDGKTPLHMAMQPVRDGKRLSLDKKVLEALLEHDADPTLALRKTGLTPLHILAESGKSAELERLAKKALTLDVFLTSSHLLPGATPLLLAAYYGNHISVQKLLDYGADPNAQSPVDTRLPTALWAAFDQKKYGSARKLLEKGANPNETLIKKFEGISLLHHAAKIGDVKAIERLLKHNASVDIRSSKQDTPLMMAVMANHFEAAKMLVENGADVNVMSKQYNNATAVIQAAKAGSLPMVHLLCRNGANVKHKTPQDNMSAFLQAVYLGHADCAIYLLALGADIHEEGTIGWRPIHYAASKGRTEVVRWLLSMGADKSARTRGAETAEDLARAGGHHDVVALLTTAV